MASLKDLKNRIKSVKSTQKITKAMKMVAAAKLRRAKEHAEAARPYAERMERVLANLASGVTAPESASPLLVGNGRDETHLIIVATSDRGLCGAFNSSIVRATRRKIAELKAEGKKAKLFFVGRKGYEQLNSEFSGITIGRMTDIGKKKLSYADAEKIAHAAVEKFTKGEADVVHVVFNHFKSAISQVVTFQQLIPLSPAMPGEYESGAVAPGSLEHAPLRAEQPRAGGKINNDPYEYEPSEEGILADLLPRNIAMQIFKALLENAASEQGARMSAMDNATRNAGEMIKKLTLVYNRTRQAAITKELIEIISGAEAV